MKSMTLVMSLTGMAYADWTGFYAGINAGIVFNNAKLTSQQSGFTNLNDSCDKSSNYSTFSPGAQLGYLYQFPNRLVTGVEADVSFNTRQNVTLNCTSPFNADVYDRFSFKNRMQGAIKGRLGRAVQWNNNILLPYLTVGASFANAGLTYNNEGGDHYSSDSTQAGWLIGAGIEWAFCRNWSARTEYYYADYAKVIHLHIPTVYGLNDPDGHGNVNLTSSNVVVGINYWF